MRTEQEIRNQLKNIYKEKEKLNENPPELLGEYTEMMDKLEHIEATLEWVLGKEVQVFSF